VIAELAMDTGMVWPRAVRSTVSRASGAEFVDQSGQRLADQFRLGVAEEMLRGFVAALDEAVGRGDQDRVAQTIEHGIQIVLGDGGFVQFLPHALERELQIAELVVALHGERLGVIAFADLIGALHQGGNRRRQAAADEPGAEQSAQNQKRQRKSGQHAADALGLNALFAEQLRANIRQRLLHLGAAHPNPDTADALHVALHHERTPVAGPCGRIAAGVQNVVARVQYLDARDVAFLEQPAGYRGNGGVVASLERCGQGGAGGIAQRVGARLQVGFQFLLDRYIGKLVGIGGVEATLIVRKASQDQQQYGADPHRKEQIVAFEAARHRVP
jgi:hypothetical protein